MSLKRLPPAIASPCSKMAASISRELQPSSPHLAILSCEASATIVLLRRPAEGKGQDTDMKQSNIELWVGAFVLIGIAAIVWFSVQSGAGVAFGGATYQVNARFANIGGLKPGSQVLIAGVPVGHVERIDLDSQYAAIVQMIVNKGVHLPSDTIASIKTSGLI